MKKGMSPNLNYNGSEVARGVSNTPRHPMRISKDSHVIQKPPSNHQPSAGAKPRQPLIIYTHSPKVIHAAPSNFMKLVQRLTGQSDDGDGEAAAAKVEVETLKEEDEKVDTSSGGFGNTVGGGIASYDENYETASSVDDRRFVADVNQEAMYRMPYLVEAEPQLNGSSDFYCSPRTSAMFQSAMAATAISPYMDYMKPYTEY
ncbi:VQ motif-containing protein 20-like [Salvia hispanica]|uniref:VQ motif-containing protein 20-like n=1 Tax=Salvia hispanica TaxID=49212 RepID=UPI002009CD00|nr:VQ motif-containing protein 20-like [Salvia hispanica]